MAGFRRPDGTGARRVEFTLEPDKMGPRRGDPCDRHQSQRSQGRESHDLHPLALRSPRADRSCRDGSRGAKRPLAHHHHRWRDRAFAFRRAALHRGKPRCGRGRGANLAGRRRRPDRHRPVPRNPGIRLHQPGDELRGAGGLCRLEGDQRAGAYHRGGLGRDGRADQRQVPALRRLFRRAPGRRAAIRRRSGRLAADGAQGRGPDLCPHHRGKPLFRQPCGLCRRKRPEGSAAEAPCDHGLRRRQRAVPDRQFHHRAGAALLAFGRPGALYLVRDRLPPHQADGPCQRLFPRAGRASGQHDLCPALFARWRDGCLFAFAGRQYRSLCDEIILWSDHAADQRTLDRDGALLLPRRVEDRLRKRPFRQPAALRHVGGRG